MKTNYEIRYAAHPEDAKSYDTKRIRRDFLIETVFAADEVNMVYSMYDRMVVGGAMPVAECLKLVYLQVGFCLYLKLLFLCRTELIQVIISGKNSAYVEVHDFEAKIIQRSVELVLNKGGELA